MLQSSLAILGLVAGTVVGETVHGVVVYSRHGDRTTKHYGAQSLTRLGASQNFEVGSDYRSRYLLSNSSSRILGISEDEYVKSQLYASAPNQGILLNTATAFLQGLYPPLSDIDPEIAGQKLNDGTTSEAPLNGYQYIVPLGESDESPDAIWIKGDDGCPAITKASKAYEQSREYKDTLEATKDFYARFYDVLKPVYNYKPENMTYKNAYDIFDLINVARIHNSSSSAREVSSRDLAQLRTLADQSEFGYNYNATDPTRNIHGKTLAAGLLRQLEQTVATKGALKFSLLAGSYDTFMSFFGLAGLADLSPDFRGLPEYAATMAFELYTEGDDDKAFPANVDEDLRVRWLFRNGTAGELETYPLFGGGRENSNSLPWPRFVEQMKQRSISDVGEWCDVCASEMDFCAAYEKDDDEDEASHKSGGSGGMSNAVAGVIGAVVTLAVVAVVAGAMFLLKRRKRRAAVAPPLPVVRETADKTSTRSGSGSA